MNNKEERLKKCYLTIKSIVSAIGVYDFMGNFAKTLPVFSFGAKIQGVAAIHKIYEKTMSDKENIELCKYIMKDGLNSIKNIPLDFVTGLVRAKYAPATIDIMIDGIMEYFNLKDDEKFLWVAVYCDENHLWLSDFKKKDKEMNMEIAELYAYSKSLTYDKHKK